jgi:hypothetical protein
MVEEFEDTGMVLQPHESGDTVAKGEPKRNRPGDMK